MEKINFLYSKILTISYPKLSNYIKEIKQGLEKYL